MEVWDVEISPMPSLYKLSFILCCTIFQDLPCTLNWGYMVLNSGYLGSRVGGGSRLYYIILCYAIFYYIVAQCRLLCKSGGLAREILKPSRASAFEGVPVP